jgi:hypothetical protein
MPERGRSAREDVCQDRDRLDHHRVIQVAKAQQHAGRAGLVAEAQLVGVAHQEVAAFRRGDDGLGVGARGQLHQHVQAGLGAAHVQLREPAAERAGQGRAPGPQPGARPFSFVVENLTPCRAGGANCWCRKIRIAGGRTCSA